MSGLSARKSRSAISAWQRINRPGRIVFLLTAVLLLPILLSSTVRSQQLPPAETDLVHFGDVVDLDVVGSFEFDWRGKLNPEGFLDGLNTYGEPVFGLCRTEAEIAVAAERAFSKLLREPKVVVRILDRSNRAVAIIDGAVRSPQRFQLRRNVDLRELIVISGGISDDASGEITIFRPPNLDCSLVRSSGPEAARSNESLITTIKIPDLLKGTASSNPAIKSGDLITVKRSEPIYMSGGVNDPKPIMAKPGLTLSRGIAMAGGLSKEALKDKVTIFRRQTGETQVIEADLGSVAAGGSTDPELMPYDIVEVSQKNSGKRKYPPVVQVSQASRPTLLPLRIVE